MPSARLMAAPDVDDHDRASPSRLAAAQEVAQNRHGVAPTRSAGIQRYGFVQLHHSSSMPARAATQDDPVTAPSPARPRRPGPRRRSFRFQQPASSPPASWRWSAASVAWCGGPEISQAATLTRRRASRSRSLARFDLRSSPSAPPGARRRAGRSGAAQQKTQAVGSRPRRVRRATWPAWRAATAPMARLRHRQKRLAARRRPRALLLLADPGQLQSHDEAPRTSSLAVPVICARPSWIERSPRLPGILGPPDPTASRRTSSTSAGATSSPALPGQPQRLIRSPGTIGQAGHQAAGRTGADGIARHRPMSWRPLRATIRPSST